MVVCYNFLNYHWLEIAYTMCNFWLCTFHSTHGQNLTNRQFVVHLGLQTTNSPQLHCCSTKILTSYLLAWLQRFEGLNPFLSFKWTNFGKRSKIFLGMLLLLPINKIGVMVFFSKQGALYSQFSCSFCLFLRVLHKLVRRGRRSSSTHLLLLYILVIHEYSNDVFGVTNESYWWSSITFAYPRERKQLPRHEILPNSFPNIRTSDWYQKMIFAYRKLVHLHPRPIKMENLRISSSVHQVWIILKKASSSYSEPNKSNC